MKKIIAFFVSLWNFFFGKKAIKEPVKAEPKTLEEKMEERHPEPTKHNKKIVPGHNNRKKTKGRFFQIVPTGRVIYHYAK
jgi:hypothetical protein